MSFPLNGLLSKSNGLLLCINIAPIHGPASYLSMNVLLKSGVANISVENIATFRSENYKVSSSFHTNYFFFERNVSGLAILA